MIKIVIADSSYIIRKGLIQLLHQMRDTDQVHEVDNQESALTYIEQNNPDLIIANTAFFSAKEMTVLKEKLKNTTHFIHLFNTPLPQDAAENQISVFDSKAILARKINAQLEQFTDSSTESEELSPREKLILQHVALGLTNKEIANKLFISAHTVISHRKNITRKLGIKTVSGLTVYAILNNIIQMEDIS
ncbi:DNA-binding response regulator [Marinilabiliaceae bacterium JC017]|nr:DNA-binding response regulator [Marinilabiliaceae bacterium JC017]